MSHIEWGGAPRAECRDTCTCPRPTCRCGYLVLPNGRCMTCYRSGADAAPKGLISQEVFDQVMAAAWSAGAASILGKSPIAELVALNREWSWSARLDDAFGPTNPTLESLLPPEGR